MEPFDIVRAVYRPKRTDDLLPACIEYIGRVTDWQALWVIEYGPYSGQWAMATLATPSWPFGWSPFCDLDLSLPDTTSTGD